MAINIPSYQSQDRGTQKDYLQYLSAMDAISVEKVASASVFYDPAPGNILVDVGMASGTSSSILAHLFPQMKVIGVDINPKMVDIASQMYTQSNLKFVVDDGETLSSFKEETISGFFNCSSIHHITSYNNYDSNRAYNTIRRQTELLKIGGIIVVRDFVKPPEMEVVLELNQPGLGKKPSDADLLIAFSKTARSLANHVERGFPLKEIELKEHSVRRFRLQFTDAVEFIRRKDYYDNWEVELKEEYGYFTQKEFEEIFSELGLRIIVSNPIYNPWIISNRYKGKFIIHSKDGDDIGFPPTNFLIAAEKVDKKGTSIHLVRHLPEPEKPFLNYCSYINSDSHKVYDVVSRSNPVIDIIPYKANANGIEILAKHGYPRPLASIQTDSPIIDHKHFSGYITEGITAALNRPVDEVIAERIGLKNTDYVKITSSLEYYPSPGGIEEKVESVFVQLKTNVHFKPVSNTIDGYADSGTIRIFDAIQLLKTAQTGALVEARLELNIYNLLRKLQIPFPHWMGEKIEINELQITPVHLNDVLYHSASQFERTNGSANYLQKHRAKFAEKGNGKGTSILEYIVPEHISVNTLIALPLCRYEEEIFVGLEIRSLPVPQLLSGNSLLPVAPAIRLPKTICNFKQMEDYLLLSYVLGAKVAGFQNLGEKFFPSIGLTPEQAYPYVVSLAEDNGYLKWVSLHELYQNLELLKDGHLLILITRLMNALA